jgi:hypothetical protein
VERHHQEHPRPLTIRPSVEQTLELRNHNVPSAELELRRQKLLHPVCTELLETPDLTLSEVLVPKVDQRGPAPEAQCLFEQLDLPDATCAARLYKQPLELRRIDCLFADREDVAVPRRFDQLTREDATQACDQVVERGPSRCRSMLAPDVVDQLVGRTGLSRVEEQRREEGSDELAPERKRTICLDDLKGPEDAERNPRRARPAPAALRMCFRFDTTYLLPLDDDFGDR